MTPYDKRVAQNLEQMSAPAQQWRAVATTGESKEEVDGRERAMPTFDFPPGYTEAPSLYKHSGGSSCCNLCGEDIKIVWWIQNDEKRWLMPVGSECVTRFGEGLSGEQVHKEAQRDRARELMTELADARRDLFNAFAKPRPGGWGPKDLSISAAGAFGSAAYDLHRQMKEAQGQNDPSTAAASALTRWANSKGDRARLLIGQAGELVAKRAAYDADIARAREERLRTFKPVGRSLSR